MRRAVMGAFLLGAVAARAAPDDRFHGGSYDGHAHTRQIAYARDGTAPWFSPRFPGGAYDGHAARVRTTYAPSGTPPWFSERFRGGEFDGFAGAARRTYNAGASSHLHSPRFRGGEFDGQAAMIRRTYDAATAPSLHSLRFRGGVFDGHERILALGLPNPLAGDTDGDGLPDGWEVRFTNSLAFLYTGGDYDGDGLPDEAERGADTHPLDALSLFEILHLEPDPTVQITVTSTNSRIYTLEVSTNLTLPAGWQAVPGQADQPGPPTGALTLTDTNRPTPKAMYRVTVEPP